MWLIVDIKNRQILDYCYSKVTAKDALQRRAWNRQGLRDAGEITIMKSTAWKTWCALNRKY